MIFMESAKALGLLAQQGCPSFVMEPYCRFAKRSARPRTNSVRVLMCLCVRLQSDPRLRTENLGDKPYWHPEIF